MVGISVGMLVRWLVYPCDEELHMGLRIIQPDRVTPFAGAGPCPAWWLAVHPYGGSGVRRPVGRRPAHAPRAPGAPRQPRRPRAPHVGRARRDRGGVRAGP